MTDFIFATNLFFIYDNNKFIGDNYSNKGFYILIKYVYSLKFTEFKGNE